MTGTLTTEELEARMRPGAWSQAGFLGPRESLSAVLECAAAAVARQGLTHERLAGALEYVLERALRIRARTRRMEPIIVGRFQVEIGSWLGTQNCPWPEWIPAGGASMDADLDSLSRDELIEEVRRLRSGIRRHRDSTGHELCWHHPALWRLLPDSTDPAPEVPEWPQFLRGCIRYRQSLDEQLPHAPRTRAEHDR